MPSYENNQLHIDSVEYKGILNMILNVIVFPIQTFLYLSLSQLTSHLFMQHTYTHAHKNDDNQTHTHSAGLHKKWPLINPISGPNAKKKKQKVAD